MLFYALRPEKNAIALISHFRYFITVLSAFISGIVSPFISFRACLLSYLVGPSCECLFPSSSASLRHVMRSANFLPSHMSISFLGTNDKTVLERSSKYPCIRAHMKKYIWITLHGRSPAQRRRSPECPACPACPDDPAVPRSGTEFMRARWAF